MIAQLPLADTGRGSLKFWRGQIEQAQTNIRNISSQRSWDDNLKSYFGQGDRKKFGKNTTLVRKDYSLTEMKKALLFYQLPDVAATAKKPEFEEAAPLVGAVVNQYLSPEYMDAMSMADEILMDLVCPAGIGVTKIGYEAFVDPNLREVAVPNPLDPNTPAMDPVTGKPVMQPNVVREEYFWTRIPPKMFLYQPTFISSNFDKAGWLGFKYRLSKAVAESLLELTDEQISAGGTADLNKDLLASDVTRSEAQSSASDDVTLFEIWYRAAQFDATVGDPEIIRQLVLLEGDEETPLIHRESPYQKIEDGRMVGGMKGYPIHVFALRYVSDQAIPQSDCSASRELVDEQSKGRTQMIDQRDRAVPITLIDLDRIPKESQNKILKGEVQELIPIAGMDGQNPPAISLQRGQWPRENFSFNEIGNREIAEAWAIGPNQQGVETDSKRTATEMSLSQGGTDTRMDKESGKFLRDFARGCQKVLALLQLFADQEDFARVADEEGQMVLMAWDKTAIAGEYGITLAPDSSKRIDAAVEKKRAIDMFSTFGNDPLIDQMELRKQVFRKLGMDPAKLVKQPPPKPPEQPQFSVSIKGDDLNPAMPQYVNIASLLSVLGVPMAPPVPMEVPPGAPATNPGTVAPVTPINKRVDTEASGELPGAGQAEDRGMVAGR